MDSENAIKPEDYMNNGLSIEKESHAIKDLEFTDLYIGPDECWMSGVPGTTEDPYAVPYNYSSDMRRIRDVCIEAEKKVKSSDFSVKYDDIYYRASGMPSIGGTVYVLRRFPNFIPEFKKLGIHSGIIEKIMQPSLTGMIIIAGPTCSGKTTTASSMIKQMLTDFGGVAVTAEDPPEMPLEGRHGKGLCYQTLVPDGDDGYAEAAKNMLRWKPNIIFLGEIRDGNTALEALRASINGHLVITTIHSDDVIGALSRIHAFAERPGGTSAKDMLADGILCVLHQTLEGEIGDRKILKTSFLHFDETSQGLRKIIKDKRFEMLSTELMAQAHKMQISSRNLQNRVS